MDTQIQEYEKLLRIDKNDLDVAIMEQADVFYRIAEAFAEARDEVDALKDDIDQIDSNLALTFRQEAENKGEKTTEGKIASQVLVDPKHVTAVNLYRQAKLTAERLGALRDAFNQRSSMLRELTNLYVSGYFSVSSVKSSSAQQSTVKAASGRTAMASVRQPITKKE